MTVGPAASAVALGQFSVLNDQGARVAADAHMEIDLSP